MELRIWDKDRHWVLDRFDFALEAESADIIAYDLSDISSKESLFLDLKAFLNNGDLAGEDQFILQRKKFKGYKGKTPLVFPYAISPNLFKPPNDNDFGYDYFAKYQPVPNDDVELLEEYLDESTLRIVARFKTDKPIPRFGIKIALPTTFHQVDYLGRGPHENYPDRLESAHWGLYYTTPEKMIPTYISPQESGYRTQNEQLRITNTEGDGFIIQSEEDFGFSYLPFEQEDLTQSRRGSKNKVNLTNSEFNTLCIDSFMMGIGGIDSWLSEPMDKYLSKPGQYELVLYITSYTNT
jgi:hypothetical protein